MEAFKISFEGTLEKTSGVSVVNIFSKMMFAVWSAYL